MRRTGASHCSWRLLRWPFGAFSRRHRRVSHMKQRSGVERCGCDGDRSRSVPVQGVLGAADLAGASGRSGGSLGVKRGLETKCDRRVRWQASVAWNVGCERGTCLNVNRRTTSERQARRRRRARSVSAAVSAAVSETCPRQAGSAGISVRGMSAACPRQSKLWTARSH